MSNDELIPSQSDDLVDDLDDVEGHGLKEVVVGLSAAAVLGGGVASAASAIPPIGGGDGLKTPGAVMAVVDGVQDDATKITSPTLKQVDRTKASATSTATQAADKAVDLAGATVTTVDGIAADAINGLRPVLDDPDAYAIATARSVANPAVSAVNATTKKLTGQVTDTVRVVDGVAADAITLADSSAKWALTVLDSEVDKAADGATTLVLGLRSSDATVGGSAASKDAVVTAKVGNEVIAKSSCDNGTWTLTIDSKHVGSPITLTVGGHTDPVTPLAVHLSS